MELCKCHSGLMKVGKEESKLTQALFSPHKFLLCQRVCKVYDLNCRSGCAESKSRRGSVEQYPALTSCGITSHTCACTITG